MHTKILPLATPSAQQYALELLATDKVIAAPTDTVYGLMARYDSAAAIECIYTAKARPPQKAIPVLLHDVEQLPLVVSTPLPEIAQRLVQRFWPGPLTLILSARAGLPPILTAQQPTVAVRIPQHDGLRQLIAQAGPLAATSANHSGGPETCSAAEVMAQLAGRIPLILDGGVTAGGVASTIVDVSDQHQVHDDATDGEPKSASPRIVRNGPIRAQVEAVLHEYAAVG